MNTMIDLSTKYMGLTLRSPLIAGSSGLTDSLEKILEMERYGVGAVVLKSLFEEQINNEVANVEMNSGYGGRAACDYIANYAREHSINKYLELIRDCKRETSIPIIASVNCVSASDWIAFASQIEKAGADAIELNMFSLPSDVEVSSQQHEELYFKIVEEVKKRVSIPVSVKISYYFSSLAKFAVEMSWRKIGSIVMFNRFFSPDIDINKMTVNPADVFSSHDEIYMPLRWTAILKGKVQCDISATTGVHDAEGFIKLLLAGANTVQVASVLYKKGIGSISDLNQGLHDWMEVHNYTNTSQFIGKLSLSKTEDASAYERVQFMKHFAKIS